MSGLHFSADVIDFLKLFHKHGVKYIIVGGEAVIYYGYPRLTGDIDFYYSIDSENITSLYKALYEFWDGNIPGSLTKEELSTKDSVIQFGTPPNRIDLMNSLSGIRFEDAWSKKITESVDCEGEVLPIHILGIEHLKINKKATGRNKDLDDLKFLEKING